MKTYAHSLKLHEERLTDLGAKKAELMHNIDIKRAELLLERSGSSCARASSAIPARRAATSPTTRADRPRGLPDAPNKRRDALRRDAGLVRLWQSSRRRPTRRRSSTCTIDLDSPDISPAKPTVVELNLHHDHNPEVHVVDAEE